MNEKPSGNENWQRFHAAMAQEEEYVAISEKTRRRRETTRVLINCAVVLWFIFLGAALLFVHDWLN